MNDPIKIINQIQKMPYTIESDDIGHAFSFRKKENTWWLLAGSVISTTNTEKLEMKWSYPNTMKVITMPINHEALIEFLEFYEKYSSKKGYGKKPAINYTKLLKEVLQ